MGIVSIMRYDRVRVGVSRTWISLRHEHAGLSHTDTRLHRIGRTADPTYVRFGSENR